MFDYLVGRNLRSLDETEKRYAERLRDESFKELGEVFSSYLESLNSGQESE
jgi:hypothetical protein